MRTNSLTVLTAPNGQNLLDNTLCAKSKQVWTALAEIGRQLQILAQAQLGGESFFAHSSPPPAIANDTLTVSELVNAFLRAKARAGRSDRYLRALRYSLKRFTIGRGAKLISEISVEEIELWMNGTQLNPRTMQGYLGDVRTLFNFALKRNYLTHNPAAGVELPTAEPKKTAIHSPVQTQAVLTFARSYDVSICRALAVRYFAGLRTCEVERISEEHLREKYIEVTAATSKGARARRRRLVSIHPNLKAWLALGGELPAPPANGRKMLEFMRAMKERGIEWPENVTRHSFCSYHLAEFGNAGKTALEAGHTEQMLFTNYREVVMPEAAKEFWNIFPK